MELDNYKNSITMQALIIQILLTSKILISTYQNQYSLLGYVCVQCYWMYIFDYVLAWFCCSTVLTCLISVSGADMFLLICVFIHSMCHLSPFCPWMSLTVIFQVSSIMGCQCVQERKGFPVAFFTSQWDFCYLLLLRQYGHFYIFVVWYFLSDELVMMIIVFMYSNTMYPVIVKCYQILSEICFLH